MLVVPSNIIFGKPQEVIDLFFGEDGMDLYDIKKNCLLLMRYYRYINRIMNTIRKKKFLLFNILNFEHTGLSFFIHLSITIICINILLALKAYFIQKINLLLFIL